MGKICYCYSHLMQRCFYRFNCDYGGPSAPTTTLFSSPHDGQWSHDDMFGRSASFGGPGQHAGSSEAASVQFPSGSSWGGYPPLQNFGLTLPQTRASNPFAYNNVDEVSHVFGFAGGPNGDTFGSASGPSLYHGPYGKQPMQHDLGQRLGPFAGVHRPLDAGQNIGSSPSGQVTADSNLGQILFGQLQTMLVLRTFLDLAKVLVAHLLCKIMAFIFPIHSSAQ
ncbi:hypothetical protein GOBAR_AA06492 [Gossypium barbadense]|uniref:Uncharacterized protein n=1 Tax=Gossypium barbadense TaxID=3634 RepID=A0A2P5YEU9_GOSBA|nr:hypothetical protein GOBAR_AA06492 [Gossypium barbadense]